MYYDLKKLHADKMAAFREWEDARVSRDGETRHDRTARDKAAYEKWQDLAHAESAARYGASAGTPQRILDLRDTYRTEED